MSWLRLDDTAVTHPKVMALSDRHFRVWIRLLSVCSQHENPAVNRGVIAEVVGLTNTLAQRFAELRLLDVTADGYTVHDWKDYRPKDPTAAERMRNYRRNKDRNGDRNEAVTRARVPTRPDLGSGTSDVDIEAGLTGSSARESLPFTQLLQPVNNDRRFDCVLDLLDALPDKDAGTETILRNMRLPEFAYRNTAEQIRERPGAGVKLAVSILQRIEDEIKQQRSETTDDDIPF